MDKDVVLKVENVSKKFSKSLRHVMVHGAKDITRDFLGVKTNSSKLRNGEFWALTDVEFELRKGESIGLIGRNGSGKSTLLKMINGIYMPDSGKIEINGKIGALIEVGAGFHPMLTGRENVYVNGAILGMSKKEIDQKFEDIVNFADISEFIDAPVKHYSSGMYVRLGFSIAIHSNPDILLVDEVLAVGDYPFQVKCMEKIRSLQKNGVSIIFVSHNEAQVKSVCSKGVCLEHGKQIFSGDVDTAILNYYGVINNHTKLMERREVSNLNEEISRRGTGQARFKSFSITDLNGNQLERIPFGMDKVKICARYTCTKRVDKPRIFVALKDANRQEPIIVLFTTTSTSPIEFIEGEGEIDFTIDIKHLGPNLYGIYAGITDSVMYNICYDIWDINGIFIEVEASDQLPKNEVIVSKPYIVPTYSFNHRQRVEGGDVFDGY